MKTTIKELKKGDAFVFCHVVYKVTKRYVDDNHPLKATDYWYREQFFHNEDLEVEKI